MNERFFNAARKRFGLTRAHLRAIEEGKPTPEVVYRRAVSWLFACTQDDSFWAKFEANDRDFAHDLFVANSLIGVNDDRGGKPVATEYWHQA